MAVFRSQDGSTLRLGGEVGRGGEGSVLSVDGAPNLVVKLYRPDLRALRRSKIEAMVQARTASLDDFVAWPMFAVYEQTGSGAFCGFAMPRVSADYVPIHNLYGPSSRRQRFPGRDWRFLIRAAENIATAVAEIHDAGHVVGDINHSNALVNKDALVHFIDADSFQVRQQGSLHRCTVGVPEFTPPELQGLNLSTVERSPQHDRFGLAVLIFKLLFMGRHPFAGRFSRGDVSLPEAIRQGLFAYSTTMAGEASPPPNTLDLHDVGDGLASLFERAFLTPVSVQVGRPEGRAWASALQQLQREANRCRRHPHHYYPGRTGSCIWCDFRTHGIDYFPDPATQAPPPRVGGTGNLSVDDALVERLWAAIAGLSKRPGFDESSLRYSFEVAPLPKLKASMGWSMDEGSGCIGLMVAGGAFVFLGPLGGAAAVALLAIYAFVGPALEKSSISSQRQAPQRQALEEQNRRREELSSRLSGIQSLVAQAAEDHDASWQRLKDDLARAYQGLKTRDATKSEEIRSATARLAAGQRESFLQSKLIRHASIHGVGDTLTSNLMSYGYESAYDVLNAGATVSSRRGARTQSGPPDCPHCGSRMQRRTARRGRNAGGDFWGCSRYPSCSGTRNIGYTSASHGTTTVSASGLEAVSGIGPVKAQEITSWARRVEQQFRPSINQAELAREKQRIEAAHNARIQQLAQELRGGPAELTSINDRFATRVAQYVVQFQTLSKEW